MSVIALDGYHPQIQKFALNVGKWTVHFTHRKDFCFEVEACDARRWSLAYSSVTDIGFNLSRETLEKVKCYIWQALPALSTLSETPLIRVIDVKTESETEVEVEVDAKTDAETEAESKTEAESETEADADPGTNSIVLEFLATNYGDGLRIPLYLPGCHPKPVVEDKPRLFQFYWDCFQSQIRDPQRGFFRGPGPEQMMFDFIKAKLTEHNCETLFGAGSRALLHARSFKEVVDLLDEIGKRLTLQFVMESLAAHGFKLYAPWCQMNFLIDEEVMPKSAVMEIVTGCNGSFTYDSAKFAALLTPAKKTTFCSITLRFTNEWSQGGGISSFVLENVEFKRQANKVGSTHRDPMERTEVIIVPRDSGDSKVTSQRRHICVTYRRCEPGTAE